MMGLILSMLAITGMISLCHGEYLMKWTNTYNGTINSDWPYGIAVDSSGNVYVTGMIMPVLIKGRYCTIKYNSIGSALWTNFYNSGGSDYAQDIAIDSSSNVYVTGRSSNATNNDYFTIKYNSIGSALWTNRYNSGNNDEAFGIAVDSSDDIYVTGSSGTIKYNPSGSALWTNIIASGNGIAIDSSDNFYITGSLGNDYRTIKFSSAGLALWTKSYDGGGDDVANGIAIDSSDNIYITGYSAKVNNDYCTIKYDSSGNASWTNFYDSGGSDYAWGTAVDSSGNVYVAGYNASWDYCIIKYTPLGDALWTNIYDSGSIDGAFGVAVATNFNPDRVFVTGYIRTIFPDAAYFTYGIPPQRPPVNFSGTALGSNAIIWQWQDKSDDEEGFQMQDPSHNIKGSEGMNITVWTEYGLSPNTSYTRHCVATNFLGKSHDSNPAIVFLGPPPAPIWISATAISSSEIDLLWKDLSNETSYTLFRSTVSNTNTTTKIAGLSANITNYSDKKLTPNTTYYYWIKAYYNGGNSGYSLVASDTTLTIPNLDNLIIGPSPFKPNDNNFATGTHSGGIKFANLTADAIIEVYTVAGQLIEKLEEKDGDGKYIWIVPDRIASGGYICRVTNSKGEEKIRKIIIIK